MKIFFLFLLLSISIYSQSIAPGDIVILAINGDADAPNSYGRGFSFMPLDNLFAGTEIFFTDYGWSDAGVCFITNIGVADAFIKYTVPAGGLAAGSVIRCDSYHTTNFTFYFSYSGLGNNYLNIAGLTSGDELLVFQGTIADPVFICAASIVSTTMVASGWAVGVGLNGTDGSGSGSAIPPGLTDDQNALSFNLPASGNDNGKYSGDVTSANKVTWKERIRNYSNWTFNDAIPIPVPPTGPFSVIDPLPVELSTFTVSAHAGKVILNWKTETEVNNSGFEIERAISNTGNWVKAGFIAGNGNSNSPKKYAFIDNPLFRNIYKYRLKQIDADGNYEYSSIVEINLNLPLQFTVKQNYPNPFNPSTKIEFSIPADNHVTVKIYNTIGVEITTLLNEHKQAGSYGIDFNAANYPSGVYFYKVTCGTNTLTKKMVLLR